MPEAKIKCDFWNSKRVTGEFHSTEHNHKKEGSVIELGKIA